MGKHTLNKTDRWVYQHQSKRSKTSIEATRRDFQNSVKYYCALLGRYLSENRNAKIFDLPCGEGRFLFVLRALGYENIYGVDLDEGRIKTCLCLGLPAERGDVIAFLEKKKSKSIDLIVSMDFLEHLEQEQVIGFLRLVNRKLVSGGRFIVRMPCADGFFSGRYVFNDMTHKWGATCGVLRDLLIATGFNKVVVFGEDPVLAKPRDVIRIPLYFIARGLTKCFLFTLGLSPPAIWSSSMWSLGEKR